MRFRTVISLAALLLFVINTALVVSDIPTCPKVGAIQKHVPGSGQCPKPADVDCSLNEYDWDYSGTAWIIWSEYAFDILNQAPLVRNYYRASSAGEYYYAAWNDNDPFLEYHVVYSFEVDLIAPTGARCGGMRYYNQRDGNFREVRTGNEDDFIMEDNDDKRACYDFDSCVWENVPSITGWREETVGTGQNAYVQYVKTIQPRKQCVSGNTSTTRYSAPYVICVPDDDGGA
jgi:hypothetical protein